MGKIDTFRSFILDNEIKIHVYKNKVNIVNYDKIIDFTSKEVVVGYLEGKIIITGNKLAISRLLLDEVLITGIIEKIELR